MGRRGRRRARAAHRAPGPPATRKSLPAAQQMARVNLSGEEWRAFRSEAVVRERSVADYLGRLVRKELRRVRRAHAAPQLHSLEIEEGSTSESPVLVAAPPDTREGR